LWIKFWYSAQFLEESGGLFPWSFVPLSVMVFHMIVSPSVSFSRRDPLAVADLDILGFDGIRGGVGGSKNGWGSESG
jgi:hypothetical protein